MRAHVRVGLCVMACSLSLVEPILANPPSGAIFTTVAYCSEVNANIYPSKEAVYLDGGPGPGAPQTAPYSTTAGTSFRSPTLAGNGCFRLRARCRQFDVANGIITNVVATGCQHNTEWTSITARLPCS